MRDLPRYVSAPDPQQAEAWRDAAALFKLLPEFEIRELETDARITVDNPLFVALRRVLVPLWIGVTAYQFSDPVAAVSCASPSWQRAPGGINITNLDGLTAGTKYVVRLLVAGG